MTNERRRGHGRQRESARREGGKWDDLKQRTKQFAHRCVKLAMALPRTPLGNHVRGQLIRCSTSAASNYRAACVAQSRASFVAKLSIVVEEVDESHFWLESIADEGLMKLERVQPLMQEAEELTAIFKSSRKTARATGRSHARRTAREKR